MAEQKPARTKRQAGTKAARAQQFLNLAPDAIVIVDREGRIDFVNAQLEQLFGYRPAELVGKFVEILLPEGIRAVTVKHRAGYVAAPGNQPLGRGFELTGRRKNGTEFPVEITLSVVESDEGRWTMAVVRDGTRQRQAEQTLRASEERLARAQRIARVGSWERDLQTGRVWWSDELFRITGLDPASFDRTFASYLKLIHPGDMDLVLQALDETLATGTPYDIDHRIVRPDGVVRVVHAEGEVVQNAAGQPIGLIGTLQDITVRREAEDERERLLAEIAGERARLRTILDAAHNPILYVDAETNDVVGNPAATRLFGHSFIPEAGREQYIGQIHYPDGRPVPFDKLPISRALHGEAPPPEEFLVLRPDGSRVPVLENAVPTRWADGKVSGAVLIIQDISPIKEQERLREELISVIAHDLFQPVTVIKGYTSLLEQRIGDTAPRASEFLHHLRTSTNQLDRMLADLLDATRVEAGRLTLRYQPTNLAALLAAVGQRAVLLAPGHEVRVAIPPEVPRLIVDPGRIEQVLSNLISNAAKYGAPESPIDLQVTVQPPEVEISVTNPGPGIPTEDLSRLFTRFYRTPSAQAGSAPGLGLGLYITKGLVEAHGGRIWIESTPGERTTFRFTVPIDRHT